MTASTMLTNPGTNSLFSKEQLNWLTKAKNFADKVPLSSVIAADKENKFDRQLFESACKEGFGALPFGPDYGGSGGDYVSFCLINEEFARRSIPIMSSLGVHVLCQEPVYRFGNASQKEKYLPNSASGKFLAAFGLTEPEAGSDTANIQTQARRDGDHYILNGTKTFITSGASADYFIVMSRLKDESIEDSPKSITAFIIEKDMPGFAIGQKFKFLGMRGYSTCEIVFSDCRVPKENMLGQIGEGRKVALSSLAKGRVTIAAQCCGWAQLTLDRLVEYMSKTKNSGTGSEYLSILAGNLAKQIESARVLMYQAAYTIDRKEPDVTLASMAKLQASEVAVYASSQVISALGPQALDENLLLERIYRDAKAGEIYEGASQIQRMLIARNLLADHN